MAVPPRPTRGNSEDRRRRKKWLVQKFRVLGPRGRIQVPCHHCPKVLRPSQVQVDRWPVCGHDGGRYTRDNIVPACLKCNQGRCNSCPTRRKS